MQSSVISISSWTSQRTFGTNRIIVDSHRVEIHVLLDGHVILHGMCVETRKSLQATEG